MKKDRIEESRREKNRKHRKRKNIIYNIIIAICILVFLFSAYQIIADKMQDSEGENEYNEIVSEFKTQQPIASPSPSASSGSTSSPTENTFEYAFVDFEKLIALNSDVKCWIEIPGTKIDYPVVQGEDNDYYLTHTVKKETLKAGSIFMDFRCAADFSDKNTIIYGHNMRNGSMFHSLLSYLEQSYYEKHPEIWFYLPDGSKFKAHIFAAVVADENFSFTKTYFSNDESFQSFLTDIRSRSKITSDVSVSASERIITLSTCHSTDGTKRVVVFAKIS